MKNQRYIVMTFFALAVSFGLALRGVLAPVLASLDLPDPRLLGLVEVSSLTGLIGGGATFLVLLRNTAALVFTDEVIVELRKVAWPTREEAVRSASIVIGTTIFFALVLGLFDVLWARLTSAFLFTEG